MEDYRTYIKNTTDQRLVGTVLLFIMMIGFFVLGATFDHVSQYQNNDFAMTFQDSN